MLVGVGGADVGVAVPVEGGVQTDEPVGVGAGVGVTLTPVELPGTRPFVGIGGGVAVEPLDLPEPVGVLPLGVALALGAVEVGVAGE